MSERVEHPDVECFVTQDVRQVVTVDVVSDHEAGRPNRINNLIEVLSQDDIPFTPCVLPETKELTGCRAPPVDRGQGLRVNGQHTVVELVELHTERLPQRELNVVRGVRVPDHLAVTTPVLTLDVCGVVDLLGPEGADSRIGVEEVEC